MGPLSRLQIAAGIAAAATLGACHGPAEVSLGGTGTISTQAPFLSPQGNDQAPGTQQAPWRTFEAALRRLAPGATLTLLDGIYDGGTTGYFNARCTGGPAGAANTVSGTDETPTGRITVRAASPGGVFLRGDASGPPLFIEGCQHWTIDGLRIESADLPAPDTPEAGSLVVVGKNNHDLVLTHLLLRHPNRLKHSHALHIGEGTSDVLVEECEMYEFHHNAVETARTSALTFRRNYINSQNGELARDVGGGFATDYASGGDFGFLFEETRDVIAENNVLENVHDGFGVVGRAMGADAANPPANPPEGNRLLGNVVLDPGGAGIRIDSGCLGKNPCDAVRTVRRTELVDDVVIGGAVGVSLAGSIGTSIQQVTVIGAANGFFYIKEPQNAALQATSATSNSLAIVQSYAFRSEGEADFSFDHCAAASSAGGANLYRPDDGHVTSKIAAPPDLGGCYVSLPTGSPLRRAGTGARDVGANVVNRYVDGMLTTTPLWLPDGSFTCGAVILEFNSDENKSCRGVHKRLNVAPAGSTADAKHCPLP